MHRLAKLPIGRRAALSVTGALLAGGWAAAATTWAPAASRPPCPPGGAHVVAHDKRVRVYTTGALPAQAVGACPVGGGARLTLLAAPDGGPGLHHSVGSFELAGSIVGYIDTRFGVDSGTHTLIVADVAAHRTLRAIGAGSYVDAGLLVSESVARFLLAPRGSLAWITQRSERRMPGPLAVHVAPRTGGAVTLDRGATIDPRSLSLAAGTLSWTDGGVRRTAKMP